MIELQQATESLSAVDAGALWWSAFRLVDELAVESLGGFFPRGNDTDTLAEQIEAISRQRESTDRDIRFLPKASSVRRTNSDSVT